MITLEAANEMVRAAIEAEGNSDVTTEVEYFLELDDDEERARDWYDALSTACDRFETYDMRGAMRSCYRIYLALGVYVERTEEELATVIRTDGRKCDVIVDGRKCDFVAHLDYDRGVE